MYQPEQVNYLRQIRNLNFFALYMWLISFIWSIPMSKFDSSEQVLILSCVLIVCFIIFGGLQLIKNL
jgi:hypothetical protein